MSLSDGEKLWVGGVDHKHQQKSLGHVLLPVRPQLLFTSNWHTDRRTDDCDTYSLPLLLFPSDVNKWSDSLSRNSMCRSSRLMETAWKPCVGCMSSSRLPVARQLSRLVLPAPSRPRTRTWVPADCTGPDCSTHRPVHIRLALDTYSFWYIIFRHRYHRELFDTHCWLM